MRGGREKTKGKDTGEERHSRGRRKDKKKLKSDEEEGGGRGKSLITADGQIIIVLREGLRKAQVDGGGRESGA